MHSSMGRLASLAGVFLGQAGLASAAPTCTRVASQWAVVFPAECTLWFQQVGSRQGIRPESCNQSFSGAVEVEDFPWNDAVVVVDNESPGEGFTLQPEQEVVQYGSGIVIMQTSWDMEDGMAWQPRTFSSAERIYAVVEYISSNENSYLDFDLSVRYEPERFRRRRYARSLTADGAAGVDSDFAEFFEPTEPPIGEDAREGTYRPAYVYSYEQESYSFSYSFELEDLESYSYEFIDSMSEEGPSYSHGDSYSYSYEFREEVGSEPPPPGAVQSVTSMDIYVCTDVQNNLAELRFVCDPDNEGDAQCFDEAGPANVRALEIHGMDMICHKTCLPGEAGGIWCDIFGLDGCRMCTDDCTSICEGETTCPSCVNCTEQTPAPSPSPTDGSRGIPVETVAPSPAEGSRGLDTMSPTSSPTSSPTWAPSAAPSGTDESRGLPSFTASPTEMMPSAVETVAPSFTDGSMLPLETAAPTAAPTGTDGSGGLPSFTASPTEMMPSAAPTGTDGSRGLPIESLAPSGTESPTSSPTSSPTAAAIDRGFIGDTLAPTVPPLGTESPVMMPSATDTMAPTYSAGTGTDGSRGQETSSPTATPAAVFETSSPTSTSTGYETPSPTPGLRGFETSSPSSADGSRGFPFGSAAPTAGSRGGFEFETASPTTADGSRGLPFSSAAPTAGSRGGFELETAAPTTGGGDGSRGIPMMSAAPTSGFTECTPGDSESCYDQLEPFVRGTLESRNRGLTCEESCIVSGGFWCNALGLNGCRFCATSCDNFCAGQGLPDDCDCIESTPETGGGCDTPAAVTAVAGSGTKPEKGIRVVDNNLRTKWVAKGKGESLWLGLAAPTVIDSVAIAFRKAKEAEAVTIVGYGNSKNKWNGYAEVELCTTETPEEVPEVEVETPEGGVETPAVEVETPEEGGGTPEVEIETPENETGTESTNIEFTELPFPTGRKGFNVVNLCSFPVRVGSTGNQAPCGDGTAQHPTSGSCFWALPEGKRDLRPGDVGHYVLPYLASEIGGLVWAGNIWVSTGCTSGISGDYDFPSSAKCVTNYCPADGVCPDYEGPSGATTKAESNIPMEIVPIDPVFNTNDHFCGIPGNTADYGELEGCQWKFSPDNVERFDGVDLSPYTRVVWPADPTSPVACDEDSDCRDPDAEDDDGYGFCGIYEERNNGGSITGSTVPGVCGRPVGWIGGHSVCASKRRDGETFPGGFPYNCDDPASHDTVKQLIRCGGGVYSKQACYLPGAEETCCGCPPWDIKNGGCVSSNPEWTMMALPWASFFKSACPTAYSFPRDDRTSMFVCSNGEDDNARNTQSSPV
eukprot:g8521.t1